MTETKMPAAEAVVDASHESERCSYEFAFHILPTVAEGEVQGVFESIKAIITSKKGELFDEEAPERFDLAYDIVQHMEGKNRKFSSAYFGWIRFKSAPEMIVEIIEELDTHTDILRHLLIKLTKAEEAQPFRFHEALEAQKMVTTVEESKVIPDLTTVTDETAAETNEEDAETEEAVEVDEKELDKALEKKEEA